MTDKAGPNFNSRTDGHDEWLTPPYIVDALGPFDLDPCSPGSRRPWDTAAFHLSIEDDGLARPWRGRVWLNPPYGKDTFHWLEKLSQHRKGVALIFARTETRGFHEFIWQMAHSIFFFKGRLKFYRVDGTPGANANAPSCLVAYSPEDTEAVEAAWALDLIDGRLVQLRGPK